MKSKVAFSVLVFGVFLTLIPAALASTTWYVDGVNGNDSNDCKTRTTACKTIGHAISLASSGDTIGVGPATYTENLTISFSLKIIGSRATTTIVDGGGKGTVVTVSNAAATVTLANLFIRNGVTLNASGGGGIYNTGTLTVSNSAISGNRALAGGGISNDIFGILTINDSTISDNHAADPGCTQSCTAVGGGIYNGWVLIINNSTLYANRATVGLSCRQCLYGGGGIYSVGQTLELSSSTLSRNGVSGPGPLSGGGIDGNAFLQNSIVANSLNGNCSSNVSSLGYNLSSDGTCNFTGPGDLNDTDPKLGTLGNYGGPTETMPLLTGSPAIDSGNPSGCTDNFGSLLKTDQRGRPRPDKEDSSGCDMGAFERQTD